MRQNRWIILFASQIVLICMGSAYAFSVFASPLAANHDWTIGQVMMAFTINISISPIPMILGGMISDRGYARQGITAGGLLYAAAFLITGHVSSIYLLYVVYGLLAGFGYNIAYSAMLSNTLRLFPEKKALAGGIITAGAGIGSMIAAPLCTVLIARVQVTTMFTILGIAYVLIMICCSFFIRNAPKSEATATTVAAAKNYDWKHMIKTPLFLVLFSLLAIGGIPGLIVSSNAVRIGVGMFGLSVTTAAIYVSIYSVSNILGRLIWGQIADKLGRMPSVRAILCVNIAAFALILLMKSPVGFALGLIGLGTSFGGMLGIFPAVVMDNFGAKHQGVNYGIVFLGYSLAGYIAPKLALLNASGDTGQYDITFYVTIALLIMGITLSFIYSMLKKRGMTNENLNV